MPLIDFEVACVRCGASLREVALDGICPHCHLDIGSTLYLPAIDQGPMTVGRDVPCRGCGYNLRTLSLGSVCPECGAAVAPSLVPVGLVFADRAWLIGQRATATMLLVCMLLPLAGGAIASLMDLLDCQGMALVVLVVPLFVFPMFVGATWALCEQEEDYRPHPTYVRRLPVVYGTFIFLGPFFLVATCSMVVSPLGLISGGAALCCACGLLLCAALSIRYLGKRAGSRGLRRLASCWAVCLAGLMALILTGSLVLANFVGVTSPLPYPWERPVEAVIAATAIAAYVLGVATIVACRYVLSETIRRRDNDTPASEQDGTEGHREKGEAACR